MKSKPGAFSSSEASDELRCPVIPLLGKQVSHFTTVEDRFFSEGEALSSDVPGGSAAEDAIAMPMLQRWLGGGRSLAAAVVGAVVIASTVLLVRSGGDAADRAETRVASAPEPATVPPPATASAPTPAATPSEKPAVVPHEPEVFPAPAPVDDSRVDDSRVDDSRPSPKGPIPSIRLIRQASAGAAAGSSGAASFDACKRAFDQHRARDILVRCADAFASDPNSVDAAVILAKTEFDRGRTAQALDWAKAALALDANRADAYVLLGGAEQAAGHKAAAKAAYKRYLQLAPQGRYASDLRAVLATL